MILSNIPLLQPCISRDISKLHIVADVADLRLADMPRNMLNYHSFHTFIISVQRNISCFGPKKIIWSSITLVALNQRKMVTQVLSSIKLVDKNTLNQRKKLVTKVWSSIKLVAKNTSWRPHLQSLLPSPLRCCTTVDRVKRSTLKILQYLHITWLEVDNTAKSILISSLPLQRTSQGALEEKRWHLSASPRDER